MKKKTVILLFTALLSVSCAQQVEEITTLHMKRECYMDSRHQHRLSIDIQLDMPTSMRDSKKLVPVQRLIITQVLGADYAGLAPLKAMDSYCMDQRAEYLKDSRQKVLSPGYSDGDYDQTICWKSRVCYQKGRLLSMESGIRYFTLDLESGTLLKLDDILTNRAALEQVLGRPLTDNFCVCEGSLMFCFTSPDGETEKASVKLSTLRDYLRREWWWLAFGFA